MKTAACMHGLKSLTAVRLSGAAGGALLASGFVLASLIPGTAGAQTADYSLEEAGARAEEDYAEPQQGMPGGAVDVAPALIPGASASIGAAQSGVRGHGGGSAMLRYDQHREITPPSYATFRLGPLYSNLGISQSISYQYTRLSGAGVDYLEGNRRGDIIKGGTEFPMVSGLTLNNYLIITRKMDLEANISVNYYHYPMDTQEDDLQINLSDEGVFATFSTQLTPSRDSRILIYDDILYRTDYIDTRGLEDRYGGSEYEYLRNTLGVDWDWKPTPLDSFSTAASRNDTIPFDSEFDRQESVHYAEMASYRRSLTPFAAAGLLLSASQAFYDADDRPDVYLYGISAFTGARLTPRLTGDASLGYQFSTTTGGLQTEDVNNSSVMASLGLEHAISEKYSQRLSWQRMLAEAFDGGVDVSDRVAYQLRWSGGLFPGSLSTGYSLFEPQGEDRNGYADWVTSLALRHPLTRLLNISMYATYSMRMNDTPGIASELPDLNSDYETLVLGASTGFKLTPNTMLSAYASHADRTSDNPDLVYTRDTVGVMLGWSHKF